MTLKERMIIICIGALDSDEFHSMPLPKAMEATARIFFMNNDQSARASILRKGLKHLDEVGFI